MMEEIDPPYLWEPYVSTRLRAPLQAPLPPPDESEPSEPVYGNLRVDPADSGAIRLHGSVLDGAGDGVPDAVVELWQDGVGFARCDTRDGGRFAFVVVKPERAPFYEAGVFARGLLQRVATRLYFPDAPVDAVLSALDPGRRETLVAAAEPDGSLRFDIRLQGDGETVFVGP
jgi:protocatechuate 3,4-dioxygenase, alpha subunit